jgi:hypothetical protein
VKHKAEGKRLTRKLKVVREGAWRFMHAPLAIQHDWYATVLRGHYGYYGTPHKTTLRSTASTAKSVVSGCAVSDAAARNPGVWRGMSSTS